MDFDINDILKSQGENAPRDYDRSFRVDEPRGEVVSTPFGNIREVNPRPSQMGVGEMIRLAERIKRDWPTVRVTQYEVGCGHGLLGRSITISGIVRLPSGVEISMSGQFLSVEEYDHWVRDAQTALAESQAEDKQPD